MYADEILERHKPVRGYPIRAHPDDGHTYTAIVEEYCAVCQVDQPCDVNRLNELWKESYDALYEQAWATDKW